MDSLELKQSAAVYRALRLARSIHATVAYLLPLLAQLSDDLLSEDLGDFLGKFMNGGRTSSRGIQRRKAATSAGVEGASSLESIRVPTPAILVVVPTRELGVQVSMLCYRLLGGGSTNPVLQPYNDPRRFVPGGNAIRGPTLIYS